MLGFRSFEIVEAISHSGNLSRAAELLDMTQPALTKALSGLEAEIGAKLFERRAMGMEPTSFARVMLQRWDSLYRDLVEMRGEIEAIRGLNEGRLRIATGMLAAASVEVALGRMVQKFPNLRVSYRQLSWSEVATAVRRAEVDIGVADPEAAKDDPLLDVDVLKEKSANFVCRKGHPLLDFAHLTIENILAYPMAITLVPSRWVVHFPPNVEDFGFQRLESGHLRPAIQIQSISAIKNIVMHSDAISIMPSDMMPDVFQAGHLVRIENFTAPWLAVSVAYITRKQSARTPTMRAFIDEVRRIELGGG